MPPLVQTEGVTKTYNLGGATVHALRGVSLELAQGDFVAVMGASGSGKSTFLYILGLLDRPTGGRYLFDGVDTRDLSSNERAQLRNERIGFVFQNFHLLARNSAIENVEVPLVYSGHRASQRRRIARSALDAVGMIGREHHLPNQLSGGQQQRVAIARALANQPSLILADEPTGALDSATSAEVMEVMQRLNRERGITIVLVTHDRDIASYADYTIRFRDGQGMRRDRRA